MTTLTSTAQFGCNRHQPSGVKAHQCHFSGCCAQFGAATSKASACDSSSGDCDTLDSKLCGAALVIGGSILGCFVGKRVIGTILGTTSTSIREFFSRLVTGKGLVEKAKAASDHAHQYAKKAYDVGFNHGAQWWQRVELYFANFLKK